MTDRRSFVAWLGSLTTALPRPRAASPAPVLRAVPTALYRQPDGRSNLVRVTVTGLDAPAVPSRFPMDGGVRAPGGLVRGESRAGGGRRAGARHPRRQDRVHRAVREPPHGTARPRDAGACRLARRLVRA